MKWLYFLESTEPHWLNEQWSKAQIEHEQSSSYEYDTLIVLINTSIANVRIVFIAYKENFNKALR